MTSIHLLPDFQTERREGRPRAALSNRSRLLRYFAMPPRFILQMPCECVAAYRMRLHAPLPVQVGSREEGSMARCMTSYRGIPAVTCHPPAPSLSPRSTPKSVAA